MIYCDVLIVGAGPAGATAAINLADTRRVMLIDRCAAPVVRIGESLPPAARRLLTDMGLWDDFQRQGHAACYGNRSLWNGIPAEHDFLRDPDGQGWHLDRAQFESWLQQHSVQRGATLLASTTLASAAQIGDGWLVALASDAGHTEVHAKTLIDASGRAATLSRQLGADRERHDALVCLWLQGHDTNATVDSRSQVEAVEQGWWYSASLPGQRRVLAFHTDADLPIARLLRSPDARREALAATREISAQLAAAGFVADSEVMTTAAHSATLKPAAGDNWCAAGDAAMSFDPLSSQGLFNAMYTGLAAAFACDRTLSGEAGAFAEYCDDLSRVRAAYRRQLDYWYAQEKRWPDAPFWQRRQARSAVAAR
jgi:flavin-dependent dehydrogenase